MGRISLVVSLAAVIALLAFSASIAESAREDILVSSRDSLGPGAYAALSAGIIDVKLVFGLVLAVVVLFGVYSFLKQGQAAGKNKGLA